MKLKTNSPEFMENFRTYIMDNIDASGYDVKELETDREKLDFVKACFESEYGHEIKRKGKHNAFASWLSGLPSSLTVAFTYTDIIESCKKMRSIDESTTDATKGIICRDWFHFVAHKFDALDRATK